MSPSFLSILHTGITAFFVILGLILVLSGPAPDEKTELEVLTRQVRGIGYLLLTVVGLQAWKMCPPM